jgi:hypothetical protein
MVLANLIVLARVVLLSQQLRVIVHSRLRKSSSLYSVLTADLTGKQKRGVRDRFGLVLLASSDYSDVRGCHRIKRCGITCGARAIHKLPTQPIVSDGLYCLVTDFILQ